MENFKFDLQIFADAGTVVNATGGYVNSGTGEVTGFTDGKTLSPELKAFYDTELLENARTEMFYAQFAKRQPLPANHHGSVEWRKWNTFDRATKLKEGVIPTTDVMAAQTAWVQAQSQKIDAEVDVKMSQVNLKKALGVLQ